MLNNLIDRIFYGGYETANCTAVERVVSRYTRGNTSIQFGRYITTENMEELRANGDRAAARLAKRAKSANI